MPQTKVYTFSCFLLLYSCFCLKAQTNKIDSLLVLAKNAQTDSGRANIFNGLASLFIYVDIDKASNYADSALLVSKQVHFPKGTAESFNAKGIIFTSRGEYISALMYLNASNKIYGLLSNKTGIARTLSNIGIVYDMQGEYDQAMIYYQKTLEINLQLNNQRGIGYSYNNIGIIYNNQGNLSRALDYYFKGLNAREKANDATGICGSYTNIGLAYSGLKDYDKALIYYQKAIDITEKYKDKLTAASLNSDIGYCYNRKKKYDLAQKFYQKALQLSLENKDSYNLLLVLNSIGENFQDLGLIDSAEAYYKKCYNLSLSLNSKQDLGISFLNLGSVALIKKEYKNSMILLGKAETIGREINDLSLLENIYSHLSDCYRILNDHAKALTYYKKYISARDSIFSEDNTKKNVQTEMNYEFDKKEASAKLEQEKKEAITAADSKKQKVIIWSVCGILFLVFCFAVFAYRSFLQKQKANIKITKQKHLIEEKQKEILDSIYYARRIQRSLLPNEKYIARMLSRSRAKPHD